MGIWTRMKSDDYLTESPSANSKRIGKMLRTYGVQILEEVDEYYKVFSPDMNCNGYVRKENVLDIDLIERK